jgi:hypothetical protein
MKVYNRNEKISNMEWEEMLYKVGLMVFSESKSREDVYIQRKPIQDREVGRFINILKDSIEFFIPICKEIRSKSDIKAAVKQISRIDVDAVVLLTPIFVSPALVAYAAILMNKPMVIMGNNALDSFSQLSLLAAGGAADQSGAK